LALAVLVFNATTPLTTGGVKRFSNELINGLGENCIVYTLFGNRNKNIFSSFIQLIRNFIDLANKSDVLHFISLSPYNIPFILLAKAYGKPIISTYHGVYTSELSFLNNTLTFMSHFLADHLARMCSDVIVSPTDYLRSKLGLKHKVVIIPNPVNVDSAYLTSLELNEQNIEKPLFVTSSNFNIPRKFQALHILLEALGEVSNELEFKLLIFGDGRYLNQFKEETSNLDNVEYMGYRDDMKSFLKSAAAYFHISGLDNQPYSVIEAMLLGKVVLATDLKGLRETLRPDSNYFVTLNKNSIVKALQDMISEIKYDRESFENEGKQNKSFALSKYSSDVVCKKYLELYGRVVHGN
jgi:glycosyltransferase involved in cell wall biosynthesis